MHPVVLCALAVALCSAASILLVNLYREFGVRGLLALGAVCAFVVSAVL
jgi:hypothetical protein